MGYRIRLMNSPARHSSKTAKMATTAVTLVSLAVVCFLAFPFFKKTGGSALESRAAEGLAKPAQTPLDNLAQVLEMSADLSKQGELARRFRLAGTILGISNSGADEPLAIIDDRVTVEQKIVRRNQTVITGVILSQVKVSSIVLSGPAGDEEIFLEQTLSNAAQTAAGTNGVPTLRDRATVAKRFGGQAFPDRWEFSRDSLLSYYSELRDEPERLLTIFDSMDPVYKTDLDGERRITGYEVGVEGEPDLFMAAGLSNGDIVRSVNSVDMTNRRRAEDFIKSFVSGTISTFVLEVERDGKTAKQVYIVK